MRRRAPSRPGPSGSRTLPLVCLGLGAGAFAVFARTLGFGFVWDDPIVLERQLPAFRHWTDFLFPPRGLPQMAPEYYRPLVFASYAFDAWLGGGKPAWFHATVVAAHAIATLGVFFLGLELFGTARRRQGLCAAALGAGLFAAHPVHVEAVAWVAGRADVFATMFGTWATCFHLRARRSPGLAWASGAALFLALASKEVALALWALLPACDVFLRRGDPSTRLVRRYAPLVLAGVLYVLLRRSVVEASVSEDIFGAAPGTLALAVLVAGFSLEKLVWPWPSNAYIAEVPGSPLRVVSGLLLLGLATWAPSGLRRKAPSSAFLASWVLLGLVPSLWAVFGLPEVPVAERYLYFPSVGFCLLVGKGVADLAAGGRLVWALATAAATSLAVCSAVQSRVWTDDLSLWSDTVAKSPNAALPFRNLATALEKLGRTEEAIRYYRAALEKKGSRAGQVSAYTNLGTIAFRRGRFEEAEEYYARALSLGQSPEALYNLAVLLLTRASRLEEPGRRELVAEALRYLRAAEELSPWDGDIQAAIGQALLLRERRAEARRRFRRALELGVQGPTRELILEELRRGS
ncbi:MAG: hypothetical protein KatS3mg076_1220 [Candidatus Binatia bacterium]|nr:MAG: hypothetical protein KatS3mg076_1220 [Candidatus Binatia bacterium]